MIYSYFFEHFHELPLDKQLHFASRLWLWNHDPAAGEFLEGLRGTILPDNDLAQTLRGIRAGELLPLHPGSANLSKLRKPYLEAYPELRMAARILYWAQLLGAVYTLEATTAIHELYEPADLDQLAERLLQDRPALAMLSTHAVNFLYLHGSPVHADFWAAIANDAALYDSTDPVQRQLQLYLLTHAVIGESRFYQRPIPKEQRAAYRQLIKQSETILNGDLSGVNLDNKLEFLVCCRLVEYISPLEPAILAEAGGSLSPAGAYLVDTHNTNQQTALSSFDKSEHRSVLFLMATLPQA